MHESFKYVNHLGEVVEFGYGKPYLANSNNLRDFSWDIKEKNNKISGFKKKITTKNIPVIIACNSEAEGMERRNDLYEIMEKDILAKRPGKIWVGEYYMNCYITASSKTEYIQHLEFENVNLTVMTDNPVWIRETTHVFSSSEMDIGLDFNNDFPYDYTTTNLGTAMNNPSFSDSNFRMVVHGPCTNPVVTIAGNMYGLNLTLTATEYVTIDSTEKTIVKTGGSGAKTNVFSSRSTAAYIFQKIPSGKSNVSLSADFSVDIVLLDERGEPKWI